MEVAPAVIRQIAWRDLFPWLILLRIFRVAIGPAMLAVATAAVVITPLGWRIAGLVFLPAAERSALAARRTAMPQAANSQLASHVPPSVRGYFPRLDDALQRAYFDLSEPLKRFFQLRLSFGQTAYYAFGFLWTLAVWSFPGGFISRRAIVQFATDAPPGIRSAAVFAARRYWRYFLAPLYPLLGIVLLAIPIAIVGLPMRLSLGLGSILAGLVWLAVAIAGLGAMWLFGGLIFGWPLMWPTISAEPDGDPFEAFSRSYSYVYGKPLYYFFYLVVAAALGALGWAVVAVAAQLVQEFGFWALAWGGGGENVETLRSLALSIADGAKAPAGTSPLLIAGATLVGLVVFFIRAVAAAFRFSYFFSAAAAIYLLLRYDADEKEMDEVYMEADSPLASAPSSEEPVAVDASPYMRNAPPAAPTTSGAEP